MASLAEKLAAQIHTVEPKPSQSDYTERPAPHDANTRDITANVPTKLESEDDWTKFVTDNGGQVAEGYRVRLVEMRHNTHGWSRSEQGKDALTWRTQHRHDPQSEPEPDKNGASAQVETAWRPGFTDDSERVIPDIQARIGFTPNREPR